MIKKLEIIIVVILFMVIASLIIAFVPKVPIGPNSVPIDDNCLCRDCNLIIISMTNLRADHIGAYGYEKNTTPNIDKLAEKSIIFENAFSHSSWTLPAGMSLFTSLYPYVHGVMNRYSNESLDIGIKSLVDVLKENGYYTASFTGGFDYWQEYGLINRFHESYFFTVEDNVSVFTGPTEYGHLQQSLPEAAKWVQENKNKKFFLFIQGFDVHCPFNPPAEYKKEFDSGYKGNIRDDICYITFGDSRILYEGGNTYYNISFFEPDKFLPQMKSEIFSDNDIRHLIEMYDAEIKYADDAVGKFLSEIKKLGLERNTIIVFLSEHGDMFGKHGRLMRSGPVRGTFYDDVIHIPVLIYNPKIDTKKVDGLVQLIDIAPTLLDFVGIEPKNFFQGKSLKSMVLKNDKINSYIFSGTVYSPGKDNLYFNIPTVSEAIRNETWKLIYELIINDTNYENINFYEKSLNSVENIELYDVKNDPEEMVNLYYQEKDIAIELLKKLREWRQEAYTKRFYQQGRS